MAILSYGQVGWRSAAVTPSSGVDADALAFITAATITNTTQQNAINTLVTDLKGYGIWSKMKAIYPFVGGTAAQHKFNLKDPRDLDAAYRLVFNGGWTHSATGALPNGTTGYANTSFNPVTISQSLSSTHLSVYTTSTNTSGTSRGYIGSMQTDAINYTALGWFYGGTIEIGVIGDGSAGYTGAISAFAGFRLTSTDGSRSNRYFKNGVKTGSNVTQTGGFFNANMYLGAINYIGSPAYYQNVPFTFSSIGDGLSDTEAANFYTAVQKYQTTLGRNVGTPIVSDTDVQAFITAATITDATQQTAINALVTDLKTANIWTKMKAIYPFVGGTAEQHRFNLKDPRTVNAAFYLDFLGGGTHSATGYLPNGNSYADTKLIPSTTLTSPFIGYYSRTNANTGLDQIDMGALDASSKHLWVSAWYNGSGLSNILARNSSGSVLLNGGTTTDSRGWYWTNKVSTTAKLGKNSTILTSATDTETPPNTSIFIGAFRSNISPLFYSNRETAFSVIADGMSDTDTTNLYTAVQKYQTTLGRNV